MKILKFFLGTFLIIATLFAFGLVVFKKPTLEIKAPVASIEHVLRHSISEETLPIDNLLIPEDQKENTKITVEPEQHKPDGETQGEMEDKGNDKVKKAIEFLDRYQKQEESGSIEELFAVYLANDLRLSKDQIYVYLAAAFSLQNVQTEALSGDTEIKLKQAAGKAEGLAVENLFKYN